MRVLDLFSGIGGFSLGLERAGMETVAFCEIEPYCQKVLAKHWPSVPIYDDVREVNRERLEADGITEIDVITGGFPCQDISAAGKQAGIEGERSGLWGELARIIGDIRPRYAIVENVTALLSGGNGQWFGRVLGDLASIGYDCEWHCVPASELGAHHHRDRVWVIAYAQSVFSNGSDIHRKHIKRETHRVQSGGSGGADDVPNANNERPQGRQKIIMSERPIKRATWPGMPQPVTEWDGQLEIERDFCGIAYGVSNRVDRLKGLGNAVVPQIPELIGRAIMEVQR